MEGVVTIVEIQVTYLEIVERLRNKWEAEVVEEAMVGVAITAEVSVTYLEIVQHQENQVAVGAETMEVDVSAIIVTNPAIYHVIALHLRRIVMMAAEVAAAEVVEVATIVEILDIFQENVLRQGSKVAAEAVVVAAAVEVATTVEIQATCRGNARHLKNRGVTVAVAAVDGNRENNI